MDNSRRHLAKLPSSITNRDPSKQHLVEVEWNYSWQSAPQHMIALTYAVGSGEKKLRYSGVHTSSLIEIRQGSVFCLRARRVYSAKYTICVYMMMCDPYLLSRSICILPTITCTYPAVGNSHVNPRFLVGWNLGLTWKFPTSAYHWFDHSLTTKWQILLTGNITGQLIKITFHPQYECLIYGPLPWNICHEVGHVQMV